MKSNSRRAIEFLKSLVQANHFVSLVLMGALCLITHVTIKLPDQLQSAGVVSMVIKLRGKTSNKLPVTVQ